MMKDIPFSLAQCRQAKQLGDHSSLDCAFFLHKIKIGL